MKNNKKPPSGPAGQNPPSISSERELIVITRPAVGLRATRGMVASIAGANVDELGALLAASGAQLTPVFGNENLVERAMAAEGFDVASAVVQELASFYRVEAGDDQLDALAERCSSGTWWTAHTSSRRCSRRFYRRIHGSSRRARSAAFDSELRRPATLSRGSAW